MMDNLTNATTTRFWPTLDPQTRAVYAYWDQRHMIIYPIMTVLLIVGVVSTVLAIFTVYRVRKFRPFGLVCILCSLFTSLLIQKLFVVTFAIVELSHHGLWHMGDAMCRIYIFLDEVLKWGITYQVLVITFYMVLSVKRPAWTQRLDTRRSSAILLGVFWSIIVAFRAEALATNYTQSHNDITVCQYDWERFRVIYIIDIIFVMFMPVFLLAGCAGYLYFQFRQEKGVHPDKRALENLRDFHRVSMALAVTYFLGGVPNGVVFSGYFLRFLAHDNNHTVTFWVVWDLFHCILYKMRSAFLPFVFILFFSDLRLEAKGLLYRMVGRAPPGASAVVQYQRGMEDEANLM